MSLINIYGDGLLDVWDAAFGEVWFGSQIVFAVPSRYHTLIGSTTKPHLLLGPNTTLYVLPGFSGCFELTN